MTQLRIAVMQYGLTSIQTEEQFWNLLQSKVEEAANEKADLLVFPEYTTSHLLSIVPAMNHEEACSYLDSFTDAYRKFFQAASAKANMVILGGTNICKGEGGFVNKATLFFPDGRMEMQDKVHLTPEERQEWKLVPGNELNIIRTQWGNLAILTCYDIEFPELSRIAADQGAELILCPSYTETAYGYNRVRNTCQARSIENQIFVALSGVVGELSEVRVQVDRGHCQAGLFAPCDYPFPPDGVINAGEVNEDMLVLATADFSMLRENRDHGKVAPFYDRRPDLYKRVNGE
jgi:predicted amidohydrolase